MNSYNQFKDSKCLVCENGHIFFPLDIDHIWTQKAYPEFKNEHWNCWTLDRRCHSERHRIGLTSFARKYPSANNWLLMNGWVENMGKWRHYNKQEVMQ